jgi:hypothetical protein
MSGAPLSRMTVVTLGVTDLPRATAFYSAAFAATPVTYPEVAFYTLPGVWLALYPRDKLAADIGPALPLSPGGFNGITLAYNARSRAEVDAVFRHVASLGATLATPPHDTFWGGYSGYFADPDGHHWEIAWGPMFEFDARGEMRFKTG